MTEEIEQEAEQKMQRACDRLVDELSGIRTNRPNPSLLDSVPVEVYGSEMKIRDIASVSVSEGRQLIVTPFDTHNAGAIGKAVGKADLGLQGIVDGHVVRVPIPPMSEELRNALAKEAKDKAEKAKVTVRDHRRKGNDTLDKQKTSGEISEDAQKRGKKLIQELTDKFCKEIDRLYEEKARDILEV
ncbi:MAG: ribosome recycling factor [Simkaniaceae bacterium]|nr:ribosome recycling factor [Simkaniaceae bacterium]